MQPVWKILSFGNELIRVEEYYSVVVGKNHKNIVDKESKYSLHEIFE